MWLMYVQPVDYMFKITCWVFEGFKLITQVIPVFARGMWGSAGHQAYQSSHSGFRQWRDQSAAKDL